MSLTSKNQLLIAFKKLVGKAHTNSQFGSANETVGSNVQIDNSTIFAQSIPTSPSSSLYDITNNVVEKIQFNLVSIPLSQYTAVFNASNIAADGDGAPTSADFTNGIHAYALKLPSDYESVSSNLKKGTGYFVNNQALTSSNGGLQIVPERYGSAYSPTVVSSSTTIFPLDAEDYILDPYAGILFLQDINRAPTSVTAYLYVGDYLTERVSASLGQFTTLTASVISASSYLGIPSSTPGGANTQVQFNSGSTFSGSSNLTYDYSNNVLSGTTAQFTTLTSSTSTGSTAIYTTISGTTISASSYLGIPSSTPGGADKQIQFNSGSTFSGSSNLTFDYSTGEMQLTGNLIVSGTLYANEYHTNIVSSSIIYSSGSTKFGDDSTDTHQFTGSILAGVVSGTTAEFTTITGSTVTGSTALFSVVTSSNFTGSTAEITTITASNITIGTAEDGDYSDGLFTTFTSTTALGLVVDRFNEVLKGLAPSQAPALSNVERNTSGGNSVNLSFGTSSPTGSYSNVTASLSGLTNVDIGGTYSVTNGSGGNPIRLGVFVALTDLTATLNNNVTANGTPFQNYPADSFNVATDGVGSYIIEMNDTILTPTGSVTNTGSYAANNFSLSSANTASFPSTGLGFDLFRHRTGVITIPTSSWRLGENYLKVTQVSSLGTHVTNYIDWVYDPQAAAGNSVYGFTTTSASFNITGEKALSGVKYYTTCTYSFSSSIANYYKNVYPTSANGGITFTNLSNGLTTSSVASIPTPANSDVSLEISNTHQLSSVRVLSASVSSSMAVNNGLGKTGNSTLTTPKMLFDAVNTANTTTVENFCLEDYRVSSASYDTQLSLTTAAAFPSSSALASTELAVYNGGLVYPTKIANSGDINGSGITYMISGQPNYAGVTENRYYYRKFVNGSNALPSFNLVLTGSNINFVAYGSSLSGDNIKIAVKVPGRTGWRDLLTSAPGSTSGIQLNDNVGCLEGAAPTNIVALQGRSIKVQLLTEAVPANESYVIRILTSKDWNGAITKLQIVPV